MAECKLASQHVPRANPQDNARARRGNKAGAKAVEAAEQRAALLRPNGCIGELGEASPLAVLLRKGLHDRNAGQCLLDVRLDAAFDFPLEPGCCLQWFAHQE